MNREGNVFLGSKVTMRGVQSQVFITLMFVRKSLLENPVGKTDVL